jgi:hypothetical protein
LKADLNTINQTNQSLCMFSEDKFLGDGGYGAVYKATYKNQVN